MNKTQTDQIKALVKNNLRRIEDIEAGVSDGTQTRAYALGAALEFLRILVRDLDELVEE